MTPRKLVPLMVLCGTIALIVGSAARLAGIDPPDVENDSIASRDATRGATTSSADAGGAVDGAGNGVDNAPGRYDGNASVVLRQGVA